MIALKNVSLLVFFSQLGLSVVVPLGGFVALGVWLRNLWNTGVWLVLVMAGMGLFVAASGFINTLRTMKRMADEDDQKPPLSYNEHD